MRVIWLSFLHMLKFIQRDMMLFMAGIAPFVAGTTIHFGVPILEKILVHMTGFPSVLSPYYGLFDIIFAFIAPTMFCFVVAMIMLEEHDDSIDRYLYVTGLGRNGYFVSHIILPALASFIITVILLPVFQLTTLSLWAVLSLSATGTLQGIIIALLIVTLSKNKLEGMAVAKISSTIILGTVSPYFFQSSFIYFLSFLPSFWIGKAMHDQNLVYMLSAILIAGSWILILRKLFNRKFSML